MAATGNSKIAPCEGCGVDIEHRELAGIYGGDTVRWAKPHHKAPCGLWCMRGGAGREQLPDYKAKNMHADSRYPCPSCG